MYFCLGLSTFDCSRKKVSFSRELNQLFKGCFFPNKTLQHFYVNLVFVKGPALTAQGTEALILFTVQTGVVAAFLSFCTHTCSSRPKHDYLWWIKDWCGLWCSSVIWLSSETAKGLWPDSNWGVVLWCGCLHLTSLFTRYTTTSTR